MKVLRPRRFCFRDFDPKGVLRCTAAFVAFAVGLFTQAKAQTFTYWTGSSGDDWFNAHSWNPAAVPDSNTQAEINTNAGPQPVISGGNVSVYGAVVGYSFASGENTSLTIMNGGMLTSNIASIGSYLSLGSANVGTGSVLITDTNSTWNVVNSSMLVGESGNGTLTLSNGGAVNSGDGILGYDPGANGTALITGPNSTWNTGVEEMYVGYNGTGNLMISNGGNVADIGGYIGYKAGSNGTALLTGANSTWSTGTEDMYLGFNATGSLEIADGGRLTSDEGYVGVNTGSNGTALVTGANSMWDTGDGNFTLGDNGGVGSVTISNGGTISSGFVRIGKNNNSTAEVLVTGANSMWDTGNTGFNVGGSGIGSLTISGGGNVSSGEGAIGRSAGSNGTALITGANSTWNTGANALEVGYIGTGSLTISNSGNVISDTAYIGRSVTGNGTALVTGTNSVWSTSDNTFYVGFNGKGNLTVSAGGNMNSGDAYVGDNASSNGTALVTGTNSRWDTGGDILHIGNSGTGGLTISSSGNVTSGEGDIGFNSGSTGTVLVSGINSKWSMINDALYVGRSGEGTLTIANRASVTSGQGGEIGYNFGSSGSVVVTGATTLWNLRGAPLEVAHLGVGSLTISDGGSVLAGDVMIGVGVNSTGSLNLNGNSTSQGVLQAASVSGGAGTRAIDFNGGILRASANAPSLISNFGAGQVIVDTAGAIIDSNGFDATISAPLSGPGDLTKQGGGTLTLNGNTTYAGNTTVTGGLLAYAQDTTLNGGATLNLQLGGTTRGTDYTGLNVTGNLDLAGILNLTTVNDFTPGADNIFDLFQVTGDISSAFSSIFLPDLSDGLIWNTSQLYSTGEIASVATTYAAWVASTGFTGDDALPSAQPLHDGLSNLLRYAMNLGLTPQPPGLPAVSTANVSGVTYLTLQYRQSKSMTDAQVTPQMSINLISWTNVDAGDITQLPDADIDTSLFQASVAIPVDGKIFFRVVASQPP